MRTDLRPLIKDQEFKRFIGFTGHSGGSQGPSTSGPRSADISRLIGPDIYAFLETTEPVPLAGRFRRAGDEAELWWLPAGINVVAWVQAAVEQWSNVDPSRFRPLIENWKRSVEWETPRETAARCALVDLESERDDFLTRMQGRIQAQELELEQARSEGDASERRLLTEQKDELVEAVITALEAFGFAVQNMDLVWPENDRREDLRVTTVDVPDWVVLVEVRGYGKGAQLSDLIRITARFLPRYEREVGALPSAVWYVANHSLRQDTSLRGRILQGNDAEISEFESGEAPGLVLDTSALLRLWLRLQRGELSAGEARDRLVGARGLFPDAPD